MFAPAAIFLLSTMATGGIWSRDPFVAWAYELGIFLLAAIVTIRLPWPGFAAPGVWIPLAAISLWGFGQLAFAATVYRFATFDAALRFASYGATAWVAMLIFGEGAGFRPALEVFAWFACLVSVVSVAAYYSSPNQILWLWPSRFPDAWGPFLSRNNFAQFLELALPVALWLGLQRSQTFLVVAAAIFAAGFASASRAGAILLIAEVALVAILSKQNRLQMLARFLPAAAAMIAIAGAGTLLGRFHDSDPFAVRREIFQATIAMVRERPAFGSGLGTFAFVYPEFAEFDSGAVIEHAHNDWLEWTAEGGLPFACPWLALVAALWRPAIRSIWGVGVLALFLHALVDYPFARHGVAAWAFILVGMLVGMSSIRSADS